MGYVMFTYRQCHVSADSSTLSIDFLSDVTPSWIWLLSCNPPGHRVRQNSETTFRKVFAPRARYSASTSFSYPNKVCHKPARDLTRFLRDVLTTIHVMPVHHHGWIKKCTSNTLPVADLLAPAAQMFDVFLKWSTPRSVMIMKPFVIYC